MPSKNSVRREAVDWTIGLGEADQRHETVGLGFCVRDSFWRRYLESGPSL
jgi:hypothetical protein